MPSSLCDLLIAELERRREEVDVVIALSAGRSFLLEININEAVRRAEIYWFVKPEVLGETDAA